MVACPFVNRRSRELAHLSRLTAMRKSPHWSANEVDGDPTLEPRA